MSKMKVILLSIALICVLGFVLAGRLLVINQPPIRSDAIIILGGENGGREYLASKLYKEKYAPYVILSEGGSRGHPSTVSAMEQLHSIEAYGVPDSAIIREFQAQDTYENATLTERIMKQRRFRSAIVVSSSYHMRRGRYIFDKVYSESNITLTYCSATVPGYNPWLWWETGAGWHYVSSEYAKLVGYIIFYGILSNLELLGA